MVSCMCCADANLVLGRILPDFFPKIFGPREDEALDAEGARWGAIPAQRRRARRLLPCELQAWGKEPTLLLP